jgi:hypothetical protein
MFIYINFMYCISKLNSSWLNFVGSQLPLFFVHYKTFVGGFNFYILFDFFSWVNWTFLNLFWLLISSYLFIHLLLYILYEIYTFLYFRFILISKYLLYILYPFFILVNFVVIKLSLYSKKSISSC